MSGFGKHYGPTTAPKSANPFQFQRPPPPSSTSPIRPSRGIEAVDRVWSSPSAFENSNPAVRPSKYGGVQRPIESPPRWADGQISLHHYDAQTHLRPPAVTSFVASRNSETSVTAKIARFQESNRAKSPQSLSIDDTVPRNSSQPILQRPSFHPHRQRNPVKLPATYPDLSAHQDRSMVIPHVGTPGYRKSFVNKMPDTQAPKQRSSGSPSRLSTKSNSFSPSSDVPICPRSLPSAQSVVSPAVRNIGPPVPKRTRVGKGEKRKKM